MAYIIIYIYIVLTIWAIRKKRRSGIRCKSDMMSSNEEEKNKTCLEHVTKILCINLFQKSEINKMRLETNKAE